MSVPPLFLAPNLFPAPSFAELAAPWALCEAYRTAMVVLVTAGEQRRNADRAVSIVVIEGDEPVGSARILWNNMAGESVLCGCARSLIELAVDCLVSSTFDFLPPPHFHLRCVMRTWRTCWTLHRSRRLRIPIMFATTRPSHTFPGLLKTRNRLWCDCGHLSTL